MISWRFSRLNSLFVEITPKCQMLAAFSAIFFACCATALAQQSTVETYTDDDPRAQSSLERVRTISARNALSTTQRLLSSEPKILATSLDMSDSQIAEMGNLQNEIRLRLKNEFGISVDKSRLDLKAILSREYRNLKPEQFAAFSEMREDYETRLVNIFIGTQLEALAHLDISRGLPKALAESPAGDMIDIEEKQIKRIKKASTELAKEVYELKQKIRKKSIEIIRSELTVPQWNKLQSLYGDQLETYPFFKVDDLPDLYYFKDYDNDLKK